MKKREPYKQFMFHFHGRNSIDARNMNEEEKEFVLMSYKVAVRKSYGSHLPHYDKLEFNRKIAKKLLEIWYPEYLI